MVALHHQLLAHLLLEMQDKEFRHILLGHTLQDVPVSDLGLTALSTNAIVLFVRVQLLELLRSLTEAHQELLVISRNLSRSRMPLELTVMLVR